MDDTLIIIAVSITGFLLGIFFFGGLWWTTQKGIQSKSPALWFLCSLLIRMGIAISVFYFLSRDHWDRTLIALVGFMVARGIIIRLTKARENNKINI